MLFFDLPKGKPGPLRVDEGQNLRRARLEAPQTSSRNDLCVLPIRHHEISSNSGIHLCLPLSPFTRVADSAEWVLGRRGGGDLRSNRVLGGDAGTIKMGTGGTIMYVYRCRARLTAPWILSWKNENCPQSADHNYYLFTAKAAWTTRRPSVRSCARSGDYPSVSRWAQAAQSRVQGRHRGLPLRHPLPSISRMYGYSPAYDIVVGQVAHFNLTPEASLCRGLYLLPSVLSGSTEEPDLHILGISLPQMGCWRPSVKSCARSGDYPSVSWWAQAAQSRWAQAARSGVCVDVGRD